MAVYINELNLEATYENFEDALEFIFLASKEASELSKVFKDSLYFRSPDFSSRFNRSPISSLKRGQLKSFFYQNRFNRCWRDERSSSDREKYDCADRTLNDFTIGEAFERSISGDNVLLLGSHYAKEFDSPEISVKRLSDSKSMPLPNALNIDAIRSWLAKLAPSYSPSATVPPTDKETILVKDINRFKKSSRHERNGRRIYLETASGRQFYVDNLHFGRSAHLEVFDAEGNHLGTADISGGGIDPSKAENGRKLLL